MPRNGTWTETGSGPGAGLIAVVAVVVVLCGGGTAGAFAAHLSAAITDLLYWIAGVFGTALIAGAAALAWRVHGRPEREARAAAARAEMQRARAAEIEERSARRAITAAHAQAQAWAPVIAAFTAAMQQPRPEPVRVVRREVER